MSDPRPVPRRMSTPADVLAPLDAAMGPDMPEVYRTLAECIYLGMLDVGSADDQVQIIAQVRRAIDVIRVELGGSQPYMPKSSIELSERDRALYERFNGRNLAALAAAAGLTERRMRDIISAGRAEDAARRQGVLGL